MKHIIFDCDGTLLDTSQRSYQLYPGIRELIEELAPQCLLYVWTARGRASTLRILEEFGIGSFFDSICTPDDCIPKPHIAGLVDLVGQAPKNSICVVGDTANDILGAKNFGVLAIGALWCSGARQESLEEAGADFIVNHPSECSKLIKLKLMGDDHV